MTATAREERDMAGTKGSSLNCMVRCYHENKLMYSMNISFVRLK